MKNIAFFADGTWNGPGRDENADGVADPTNVFALFEQLDGIDTPESKLLQNEQEKSAVAAGRLPAQIAKYIHGVGDSRNWLVRVLGGGFGSGTIARIVRGYTFVSRNYEPGDRIYIAGFSRGAYTARALAGLICSVGLLDSQKLDLANREAAYPLGVSAWVRYRRNAGKRSWYLDMIDTTHGSPQFSDGDLIQVPSIAAVGVWDTVGALGIPAYAGGARTDLFEFADRTLNLKVEHGFHAVSMDEERADFTPTLWNPAPNVSQIWFCGAHADVGGGYPDHALSDIALGWMASQLAAAGLRIRPDVVGDYTKLTGFRVHYPMETIPWRFLPRHGRVIPPGSSLHESVEYLAQQIPDYRSIALALFRGAR